MTHVESFSVRVGHIGQREPMLGESRSKPYVRLQLDMLDRATREKLTALNAAFSHPGDYEVELVIRKKACPGCGRERGQ